MAEDTCTKSQSARDLFHFCHSHIIARILISSFLHFCRPRGNFRGTRAGHSFVMFKTRKWPYSPERRHEGGISIKEKNSAEAIREGELLLVLSSACSSERASLMHVKRVVCTSAYSYAVIKGLETTLVINVERSS